MGFWTRLMVRPIGCITHGASECAMIDTSPMDTSQSDETVLRSRYRNRQDWPDNYRYKDVKGARIARLIRDAGLPSVALEIGVGRGGVAVAVSRRGIPIIGLELSPDILQHAKTHARGANVRLLQGSGFSLPFLSNSLPLVYASQVLHLFDANSRLTLVHEVYRVLEPGGRFIFDMKNLPMHLFRYLASNAAKRRRNYPAKSEIASMLRETGFRSVVTRPGVLPLLRWENVPNVPLVRAITHTTFFIATRS